MTFSYEFNVPKHNILKIGKEFDLDTLSTDDYEVILLSNTTNLDIEDLDTFDAALEAMESNPANYTRTNIPLVLTEITHGYQIDVSGANVTIPIESATINGILIINSTSKDILAAVLDAEGITITSDLTIVFTSAIWVIGETVCMGV